MMHFPPSILLLLTIASACYFLSLQIVSSHEFPVDGTVLELDDSNFDSAISTLNYVLVDFYAPWCGHCKRLNPQLDAAASVLAKLDEPVVIAKVNADKLRSLASRYEIDGFPTLMLFMHGVPIEYTGPRKADLLVQHVKKLVAPDVSLLDSDSEISKFVELAGKDSPIFIGFGLEESSIGQIARKYKKNSWFSVAKAFSEDAMVAYDFDKVPALVCLHLSHEERSVFYGPWEVDFLEDFIKQNQLPLLVPINYDTLKSVTIDERKAVLTIMEDELAEKSLRLIKLLKAAASANRDLIFGYVGVKQWEDFVDTFGVNSGTKLPKVIVWDKNEEYVTVAGSEVLDEEDQGSQISRFLEGYRAGRTVQHKISGPSFIGFINSLISIKTVYLIVFIVVVIMLIQHISRQDDDDDIHKKKQSLPQDTDSAARESGREEYGPDDKED